MAQHVWDHVIRHAEFEPARPQIADWPSVLMIENKRAPILLLPLDDLDGGGAERTDANARLGVALE